MTIPNTPVPDELAEVRARIKALEEREAALRSILLSDPSARTGNRFAVEVREVESQRVDLKELRAAYPTEVDEHTYPVTTKRLELRGISDDGELVSARKMKEQAA